jgi:hypothetical protein
LKFSYLLHYRKILDSNYQYPKRIPETIDLQSTASISVLASADASTLASADDFTASEDVIVVDAPKIYKPKQQRTITGFFTKFKSVNAPTSASSTSTTTSAIGGAYICRGCGINLRNAQGIGRHIKSCTLYEYHIKNNAASSLFKQPSIQPTSKPPPPILAKPKGDGRINNGGSNYRAQYSFSQKHSMVEDFNQWKYSRQDNHLPSTLSIFCEKRYGKNNARKFEINLGRWRSNKEWPKIVEMAKEQDYRKFCKIPQNGKGNKFPRIEVEVYALLKERRKKKRKASRKWVQITALKEFKNQYKDVENPPSFKVSISYTLSY